MKTPFFLVLFLVAGSAFSGEMPKSGEALRPRKNHNFEQLRIETAQQRPLDSFRQLGEGEKRRKRNHLYDLPSHFYHENALYFEQMRSKP